MSWGQFCSKLKQIFFFKYLSYLYLLHLNMPWTSFGAKITIFYFGQKLLAGTSWWRLHWKLTKTSFFFSQKISFLFVSGISKYALYKLSWKNREILFWTKFLDGHFCPKLNRVFFFSQNHFAICIFGLKIFWDHIFEKNHGIFISGKNFLPVGPRAFSSKIETSLFFWKISFLFLSKTSKYSM